MKNQDILTMLAAGKCNLSFKTTDNRTIVTEGTINPSLINGDSQKTFETNQGQNPAKPDAIVFFDTNENRIRSFLVNNLISDPITA